MAEAKLRAPSNKIALKLPKRLPRLDVDARRIRQVVDSIIDNAIQLKNAPHHAQYVNIVINN